MLPVLYRYLKNNSAFANLGCLAILYMVLANVRIFLSQELDVDPSLYPILAEPSFRTSRTHHLVIQPIVTEMSKALVNTASSFAPSSGNIHDGDRSMYLPAEWGPPTREATLLGDSATTTRCAGLSCVRKRSPVD